MLVLSNEDAAELLSMKDCIAALEEAYREMARGAAVNAQRADAVCGTGEADTVYSLKMMGAVLPAQRVGVLRLNSDIISFANQRQKKLPRAPGNRYTGLVLLFSAETGEPLAIFPDGILQRLRVGATSLLGAKYLARREVRTIGLLGAGWQAGGHVLAMAELYPCATVRCYSPTAARCAAFCAEMSRETGMKIVPAGSVEQAVRGAEAVFCTTNSSQQVFSEALFEPGMHLTAIRGPEVDPAAVRGADVVVVLEQLHHESGNATAGLNIPRGRHVIPGLDFATVPSLPQIVAGECPGRTDEQQRTCFVNLPGMGLQFAAVGAAFYRNARAAGRGHELPTEWFTEDVIP